MKELPVQKKKNNAVNRPSKGVPSTINMDQQHDLDMTLDRKTVQALSYFLEYYYGGKFTIDIISVC
jgi:hypothetical protein